MRFSQTNFDLNHDDPDENGILKALGQTDTVLTPNLQVPTKSTELERSSAKAKASTRQRTVQSWRILRKASELGAFQWTYGLVTSPVHTKNPVAVLPLPDYRQGYRKEKDGNTLCLIRGNSTLELPRHCVAKKQTAHPVELKFQRRDLVSSATRPKSY
jgi:hypothetical protein